MLYMPPCLLNALSLAPVHTPVFTEAKQISFLRIIFRNKKFSPFEWKS